MKPWKKTRQAIEMYEDRSPKGEYKKKVQRIVRAKLKAELQRREKEVLSKERFSRKLRF